MPGSPLLKIMLLVAWSCVLVGSAACGGVSDRLCDAMIGDLRLREPEAFRTDEGEQGCSFVLEDLERRVVVMATVSRTEGRWTAGQVQVEGAFAEDLAAGQTLAQNVIYRKGKKRRAKKGIELPESARWESFSPIAAIISADERVIRVTDGRDFAVPVGEVDVAPFCQFVRRQDPELPLELKIDRGRPADLVLRLLAAVRSSGYSSIRLRTRAPADSPDGFLAKIGGLHVDLADLEGAGFSEEEWKGRSAQDLVRAIESRSR